MGTFVCIVPLEILQINDQNISHLRVFVSQHAYSCGVISGWCLKNSSSEARYDRHAVTCFIADRAASKTGAHARVQCCNSGLSIIIVILPPGVE